MSNKAWDLISYQQSKDAMVLSHRESDKTVLRQIEIDIIYLKTFGHMIDNNSECLKILFDLKAKYLEQHPNE